MLNKILLPFLFFLLLPIFSNAQEVKDMKETKAERVYYLHNGKFIPKDVADKYEKPHHIDNRDRNIFGDV